MFVLLHGAAGGWDEVAIAVAAFAVLWVAVKLAGRKPASEDDGEAEGAEDEAVGPLTGPPTDVEKAEKAQDPAHSSTDRG